MPPNNSNSSDPLVSVPLSLLTTEQKQRLGYGKVVLFLDGAKITAKVEILLRQALDEILEAAGARGIGTPSISDPIPSGDYMFLMVESLPVEKRSIPAQGDTAIWEEQR